MTLLRFLRVTALSTLLGTTWSASAMAGPGSGSALLSPSGNVAAGTVGTWTLTYTAAENFKNGTLRLTIPSGWTAPQSGVAPGYVTVATNQPVWIPAPSIGGQVITIPVDTLSTGNTVTITYGAPGGQATAATTPGAYTFLVASDPAAASPAAITASPAGQVIPGAPSYITISPVDSSMTAGDFAPYRLFVFDAFDNRAPVPSTRSVSLFPGTGQFFLPADHVTPVTSVNIPSGQSTVRIDYRGTMAGSFQIFALPTGSPPISSALADVTINAAPLSTSQSTIAATSPVTADGTSQSSVVVTSRDAFGNPRAGDTVTIAATGSAVATNPSQQTQSNGTATGVVTNTVAQLVTVSATINGQPVTSGDASISFVAGPVSATTSTVDATTPVIANGVATSTITVTARDANGNAIAGQGVALAINPTGNAVLTQPGGDTNALGQVTGTLSSTTTGNRTVTATVGATVITDNAIVNFTAGPIASFVWTEVDGAATAGAPETVRLTAKDALGHTVTNYTGTVTLSASSGGTNKVTWATLGTGVLTPAGSNTATYTFAAGDSGTVQFNVTDILAETITLSANAGGPSGVSSPIVLSPAAADKIQLIAGGVQSGTVNNPVATPPRVRVLDANDNPVIGATVTFSVITTVTGVGTVDVTSGGAVDSTGTTDANGFLNCDVWRLGTTAGPNRLRALIASGSIPSVDFTATGTAGTETSLVLSPSSKNVTVSQTEDVVATLKDQFNNPKAGTRVDVAITNVPNGGTLEAYPGYTTTQLSLTSRWGTTDAAGEVRLRFRAPSTAGTANTVDASTSAIGQGGVTDVIYTSTAAGGTNLRITFVGSSTGPAGTTITFDVEAVDGIGNRDTSNSSPFNITREVGSDLLFSESDFGATVTSSVLVSGIKRIYTRGTLAGDWDITVDGSGLGPDTKTATITDTGVIDHYDVSVPASVTAGATFNVSVTARDQYGNRVVGASNVVNLEAIDDVTTNPALSTLQVGQTTLTAGLATQSETYTKAEPIRVRASASGKVGISGILTVNAAAAYRVAKVSGDATGVAVGAARVLVAQVLDQYDNPKSGTTVTFSVQDGGGSVLPVSIASDAAGNAQTTLTTGLTPGNNAVKAIILDENPPSLERVDYLVETVPGGIAYFTVVPAKFNPVAGEAVNLAVTAYDAQDNLVSGDSSTQIQLSSASGTVQFGAATGTLTNGVFTTTVTDNVAESYSVTAELFGGGPPTGASAVVTVGHAPAYDVVKISGDASGVTAGNTQLLQVRVRDQYGNPIASWPVAFAVASSPGGAFITDTTADPNDGIANTDATGLAVATVHTSLVQGANTVNAQIYDGNPPAQERVTFTVNTQASSGTSLRITFLGPTTINAGGTSSFKVDALDAGQNLDTSNNSLITLTPEPGSNVEFSVTGFPATVTQFNLESGTKTILVRGTKTGDWDITADDGPGNLGADTKSIHVNDSGVVDHYFVTAPSNSTAGATWNLSIEARDAFNNRVTGATNIVNLAAVLASDSLFATGTPLSSATAALVGGAVVTGESYVKAQTIRVRARDAGSKEGFSGAVAIGPAAAFKVSNVSGDGSVVAGSTQPLVARVFDVYDNPVPGQLVSYSVVSGGGSIVPPASGNSDASGAIVRTLTTGTVVGSNVARATILSGTPPNQRADFTVTTTAGAVANYLVEPVDPLKTNLVANETTNVRARARDQYNNFVTQDNTTVVNLSATGSAVLGNLSGTLALGVFTTTVRDDKAETFTVTAQSGTPTGTSGTFTVSPGPAYQVVPVTVSPVNGVSVGAQQPLVSEVRDQWNNPVGAGVVVTHMIVQKPDTTAELNDTVGPPNDGITTTAANGRATIDLRTADTAGLNRVSATIDDGTPAAQERITYDVNTVAGAIHHYDVTMGATSAVAGSPVSVTILAKDINDNPVDDDATQVALSAQTGTGLVFGVNPVTLTNGSAATTVTSNLAQSYSVLVNTVGIPATSGSGATVTVSPAAPAGAITASASADTLTANGTSITTITSGVITDAFGNKVPAGGGVNVGATNGGTVLGTLPKIIDSAGKVQFDLRSSTTPGTAVVTMTTVAGTASGSKNIVFAQPVAFTANTAPTPAIVRPGDSVAFSVLVSNTSSTRANLTTATSFSFSDGTHVFSASLAGPQSIAPSGSATLVFNSTAVSSAFGAGLYTPVVTLVGSDAYGAAFSVPTATPFNAIQVTSVTIAAIGAPPQVSRGQTRNVTVDIHNDGATPASITDVTLSFIGGHGVYSFGAPSPALPFAVAAGNTETITIPVTILPASNLGVDQIDAFVQATVGGQPVTDNSLSPLTLPSWEILAQASLSYVAGTLSPASAARGKSYAFQLSVRNNGTGVVSLNPATTRLTFTDGTNNFSAAPVQAYAIAGGATQALSFVSTAIPGGFQTGLRDVVLNAQGTDNGAPFSQLVSTAAGGDQLNVVTQAQLSAQAATLSPTVTSQGATAAFTIGISNSGGSAVVLTPGSTTLSFPGFSATLNPAGNTTILPNAVTTLSFQPTLVSTGVSPGSYAPNVQIVGSENGLPLGPLPLASPTSVLIQAAPDIAISAILTSQPSFSADQARRMQARMVVTNNGGATVSFTSASLRLFNGAQERTSQFAITNPVAFASGGNLGPGATDSLVFQLNDAPGAMSAGNLSIEGLLNVQDVNTSDAISANTNNGGKGTLLVQTPAVLTVSAVIPSQTVVTAVMAKHIKIRAVIQNTGQSSALINPSLATLAFAPTGGWGRVPLGLSGGDNILAGGETDTVTFDVGPAGSIPGTTNVTATVSGSEINSGRGLGNTSPTPTPITVQSAGDVDVTGVVSSRTTITNNGTATWTLTVSVANPGQSAVAVDLGSAVGVTFGSASVAPSYSVPLAMAHGDAILSGGESDQFVIQVQSAGSYAALGPQGMQVNLTGTEINSGAPRNGNAAASVTVQAPPAIEYLSLTPPAVAKGVSVPFNVTVRNPVANGATITLDRAATRLQFAGGTFDAGLLPTSLNVVAAGQTLTLNFAGTLIPGGATGDQNDAQLIIVGTDNGNVRPPVNVEVSDGDINVVDAPELSIVSLVASRQNVTVGQTSPAWTITMTVRNLGGLPVILDLDAAATFLQLNRLINGANVTSEYTIIQPLALAAANDDTLAAGATDALVFGIQQAGATPGTVVISGDVMGTDTDGHPVTGNTDAGGSGTFTLQSPAALSVLSITPARTTATVGQTATYRIRMAVKNEGQADADLNLTKPNTNLTFSGGGWTTTLAPALAGGGVTLGGGETDTVTFTVNTTGSPAGVTAINGNVSGVELNTGALRVDDTTSGGSGGILLQNPASVSITQVTVSRASVTANSVAGWNVQATVSNSGGAPARLALPGGAAASVQDGTVPFGAVTAFLEGGDVIPAGEARTLRFSTGSTGAFSGYGNKTITVTVNGVDVNSNDPLGDLDNTASVLVQTAPNLQLVSVAPDTLTIGSNTSLAVRISNSDPNAATAVLDRASTRVYFAGVAYSAFLDLSPVPPIPGGGSTVVQFEAKFVSASIAPARYDANLDLVYTANGVTAPLETRTITNGITVEPAPQLSIVSIEADQTSVTAGQTAIWTVSMRIGNNGSQAIALDLTPAKTRLEFVPPGGTPAGDYVVTPPSALLNGGGGILAAGADDYLVFTVTQTGFATGLVAINGRVAGLVGGITEVSDDTFDGGSGLVSVQSAASVAVAAIHATQPKVTAGQSAGWGVRVILTNAGSADVDIALAGSSITFDGAATGWTIGPATLLGGGNTLEGGAVDSLLFNIDVTGPAGTPRIDALVPYVEVNTQLADTLRTTVSGFGSVEVQTPPRLRIATTTLMAPNVPNVNTSQGYSVAVQLENSGEADAVSVQLGMTTSGASTIPAPAPIALVPGTQTVLVPLAATAGSVGTETLTTRILSVLDANSGDPVAPVLTGSDSTALANVQTPAQLAVGYVRPSQPSVTQGQSVPWNVTVAVQNNGQADLDLTAPTDDDLGFSVGGTTEIDYVVQPPVLFGSGRPAWRLAGGAVDSLIYTIVATGSLAGTVDISAGVAGSDRNQPSNTPGDNGATQVIVQPAAGLSILSTLSVGTVNHATANRDTVNTGFAYQIQVGVQNRGGETVDSVLVELLTDDGSNVRATSLIRRSIDADSLRAFVFDITAPASSVSLETFTASILPGVVSHNSGQPVTPQPPVDNTQVVVTRFPANLAMTLTTPAGTVSPGQQFQLTARVVNSGQALLSAPVQVTLTPPATGGSFGIVESLVRTAPAGQPIVWNVTAPPAQQAVRNFICAITATPNDVNTGQTATVTTASAQQAVTVSSGGSFAAATAVITAPAGAVDDTVSVAQTFTVHAQVNPSADTDAVTATLSLPAGFSVVGSSVRNLGNGAGLKQTDYSIIAPSAPGAAADVFVTFTGTDHNSGLPVPSAADTVSVTTVPRTSLAVSAAVTAPPEAVDNTVGVNSPFTVTATVANAAGAAGIGAPGTLTIALPTGYSLATTPPQTVSKPFSTGVAVQWLLVSPGGPQGPDQISVTISAIPPDENSGQLAQVTTNSASIAMVTEGAIVNVTNVTGAMNISHGPVPGGTAGTQMLAFAMEYNSSDGNAPNANIDSLFVTVLDKDGRPLGNGTLAQTLERMTIDLGGAQPYEVVNPSVNPVLFNVSGGGADRVIAANATATAVVTIDLDGSPRVTEFTVGVRANGIVIRDSGSATQLGVADGNGRPLDGQITSDPLIVLSSNFEEYVHNYPNPFSAGSQSTRIAYFLEQAANVTIKIYAMTGELVWEESIPSGDARAQAGPQEALWDGRNGNGDVVRNGVYVCVLSAGSKSTRFNIAVAK